MHNTRKLLALFAFLALPIAAATGYAVHADASACACGSVCPCDSCDGGDCGDCGGGGEHNAP